MNNQLSSNYVVTDFYGFLSFFVAFFKNTFDIVPIFAGEQFDQINFIPL